MSDKVTVEALEYYTHEGKEYHEGDTHTLDEAGAENLVAQRKAKRVEDVAATSKKKESHPVEPITTESFLGKQE